MSQAHFTKHEHRATSNSNTYIQLLFHTEPIGKLVINDNPNQLLLAVSILTGKNKSTIF